MSIEDIEIPELKEFAQEADENGWDVDFTSGILNLSNHSMHQDISVCWKKGNESWSILKKDDKQENIVAVDNLEYPSSILF
jgi:hypothetical protein